MEVVEVVVVVVVVVGWRWQWSSQVAGTSAQPSRCSTSARERMSSPRSRKEPSRPPSGRTQARGQEVVVAFVRGRGEGGVGWG